MRGTYAVVIHLFLLFFMLNFISACSPHFNRNRTKSSSISSSTSAALVPYEISVSQYYNHGTDKWNDYVKSDDSADCVGNEGSYTACLHAGEKRKVTTLESSCSGLAMTDHNGWMDWTCSVVSGLATFTGTLKTNKSLDNLILDSTKFNSNKVTLTGCPTCPIESSDSIWWSNTVLNLVDNGGTGVEVLNSANSIYVADRNTNTDGYSIQADGIAVLVKSGSTLNLIGPPNCDATTGTVGAIDSCVVFSDTFKFLYIEATIQGNNGDFTVLLADTFFSKLRNISITQSAVAISLINSNSITLDGLTLDGSNRHGIIYTNTTSSLIKNITMTDVTRKHIELDITSGANLLQNINLTSPTQIQLNFDMISIASNANELNNVNIYNSNPSGTGVALNILGNENSIHDSYYTNNSTPITIQGIQNKLYKINFSNNLNNDVAITNDFNIFSQNTHLNTNGYQYDLSNGPSYSNIFSAITSMNGSAEVFNLQGNAHGTIVHNAAIVRGDSGPIKLSTNYNTLSQIAFSNMTNNFWSIDLSSNYNKFTGNLLFPNTNCSVGAGIDSGLDNLTCANNGTSDANLVTGTHVLDSFVQSVGIDSINSEVQPGGTPFGGITEWISFENFFRAWGFNSPGICSGVSLCTTYDLSLLTSSDITNRSGDGINLNHSDDGSGNYLFPNTDGGCPSEVKGTTKLRTTAACSDGVSITQGACTGGGGTWFTSIEHLANAIEVMGDSIGNDNGLCESNEDCLYTPNFGTYQGHGTLTTCAYNDGGGSVTGVTMYGYPSNGR